ncbi:hypothetical protein PoB_000463900 [Plakobranchus ocellatus]|uniref:Uncharacterized protein n=1 Tax=Plakobranchus ocellatus TaxID=259542 RepID=A0AAV3Y5A6_9GAST|nr:hypothetical protein PoB_000463900 [Plakobranchus ocellatus]
MAPPFPLSNRASDVRPGCKTQRIAPTLRQVADLVCAPTKEREYFKTCIVGHVNCCFQCGPTLNTIRNVLDKVEKPNLLIASQAKYSGGAVKIQIKGGANSSGQRAYLRQLDMENV